jgi:hypothetical protein
MVVGARKCRDRDQQEEVGRMVRRLMEEWRRPSWFSGIHGIHIFMILLSSDGCCFPFFLTLELDMSSLAFNGKRDKASALCRIEALVFFPTILVRSSIVLISSSQFMRR